MHLLPLQGCAEARVELPQGCIGALAALPRARVGTPLPAAAESALVNGLALAVGSLPEAGGVRKQAQADVLTQV